MAITITWPTKVINVPQADLVNLGGGIYELDIDLFRIRLNELQASEAGIPELTTHEHNAPVTIAGVDLARVVRIINGYTVTFENGSYAVNLIGANSNIADVTNINNVSIRSANTAGLTYSKQVEDQTFTDSRVWIDVDTGAPGVIFPTGTPGQPVNNLPDAQSIIANRVLPKRFRLRGALAIAGENLSAYDIQGAGTRLSSITFDGSSTLNSHITATTLSGTLSGTVEIGSCNIIGLNNFVGGLHNSGISGSIILDAGAVQQEYEIIDCHSDVAGTSTPVIDANNALNPQISIRNFTGGMIFKNFSTAGSNASIDCISGRITLDPTCVSGTIVVGGLTKLTDNSGVNCTVIRSNLDPVITEQVTAYSTFITLDAAAGIAGQMYPTGTPAQPSNNLADALALAATYGLKTIRIIGTVVVNTDVSGLIFQGVNALTDVVALVPGAVTTNTTFENLILTGLINGPVFVRSSGILSLVDIGSDAGPSLFYESIFLESTHTFKSGLTTPGNIQFIECVAGVDNLSGSIIDFASTESPVAFRNYVGKLQFKNISGSQNLEVGMTTGKLILDSSCVSGTVTVSGIADIENNSSLNVITSSLLPIFRQEDRNALGNIETSIDAMSNDVASILSSSIIASGGVISGSTSATIRTDLAGVDEKYEGMFVIVSDASGAESRSINGFSAVSGTVYVDPPLTFTPSSGSSVIVMGGYGGLFGKAGG